MADTEIDHESFFQNQIDSLLVTTSWFDNVKDLLGLEAVSQIWEDRPAWYIWISNALGVYRLQLDAVHQESNNGETITGIFAIKCYPFPDSAVFNAYSYEEQYLTRSRLFDHTHTPCFEEKDNIPDPLFKVAALELAVNRKDNSVCFTLESLNKLRQVYQKETVQEYDYIKRNRRYAVGETGRSIPGWKLGYPLFDRLLAMYAFSSKTKPVRVSLTHSPGFEYVYNGMRDPVCVDAPDITYHSASVLWGHPENSGQCEGLGCQPSIRPEDETDNTVVILDKSFHCGHYHPLSDTVDAVVSKDMQINELWWTLADAEYKSELSSTCGCA